MTERELADAVRTYIDRVVNQRDITAVDECVSQSYRGSGPDWPTDRETLRRFYEKQYADRPHWHIDVQETVQLGDSVVARALAGGPVVVDGTAVTKRLEWLAHYRLQDGLITEINLLSLVPHGDG